MKQVKSEFRGNTKGASPRKAVNIGKKLDSIIERKSDEWKRFQEKKIFSLFHRSAFHVSACKDFLGKNKK